MTIYDYVRKNAFKIVVAGDGAVGKTTVGKRISGKFNINENLTMTPGVDFHNLKIQFKNNLKIQSYETIDCQIWDLGGQEQFRYFQDDFFNSATMVVLVFAVNLYHSFINLKSWVSLISKELLEKIYLIANKIDADNRSVPKQKALEFANKHNMTYYEISALTGEGFDEFKEDLSKTIEYVYIAKD